MAWPKDYRMYATVPKLASRKWWPDPSNHLHVDENSYRARPDGFHDCPGARSRAVSRRGAEEDFSYADTYAKAAKKEERCCHQKEVAESHADSEEILDTTGGRIARSIRDAFLEKEANPVSDRGIAIACSKKEKKITDANANAQCLPTSKEKKFAIPTTVRNTIGVSI